MSEVTQIFIGSMIVAFSGALVPGPMFTLVIASASEKGFWTSFFIVLGHSILELIVVAIFLLGVLKYLNNPIVLKVIGIFGGAALLYLGGNLLFSVIKKKIKLDFDNPVAKNSLNKKSMGIFILKGAMVSIINPYWIIWWISIGAAFLIKSVRFDVAGISSFYLGHISADFIWFMFIGFIVSTSRKFFNKKVYMAVLLLCSLFLFYLGIKFIIDFTV